MASAFTGYIVSKILNEIVGPDVATPRPFRSIEAYDRGRHNERNRIRTAIHELLAAEKIILPHPRRRP